MTIIDARDLPVDPTSAARLSATGLEYRTVDLGDDTAATAYQRALDRGFLGVEATDEARAFVRDVFSARRCVGVYDPRAVDALPVATVNSWVTPLTVPGGAQEDMWAISGVTVASTHRRRGIARSLLEGELRSAAAAGVPLAGLTVTEATIYGRYGFGSAVPVASLTVDTRRAGWAAPTAPGRLEYVDRETLAADLGAVHERTRLSAPGGVAGWKGRWEGHAGVAPNAPNRDAVRGVRHVDESGAVTGAMAYSLTEKGTAHRFILDVRLLVAETPQALSALWRFAVQHDLVDTVTADLRPVDDPLPWLVVDQRGVTKTEHDHGWLRVLDVARALEARRFSAPLDVVLHVEDPLGIAAGDWRLRVDAGGDTTVDAVDGGDTEADVVLDVSALSSLYAGGVRASTLHAAGRITAETSMIAALDRAFVAFPAPTLDIWY